VGSEKTFAYSLPESGGFSKAGGGIPILLEQAQLTEFRNFLTVV
jgi:hypothetical protein